MRSVAAWGAGVLGFAVGATICYIVGHILAFITTRILLFIPYLIAASFGQESYIIALEDIVIIGEAIVAAIWGGAMAAYGAYQWTWSKLDVTRRS